MRARIFPFLVVVMLFAAAAPAEARTVTYSGFFLVGEPIGFFFADACVDRSLEGVNSNCVTLEPGHGGMPYDLSAEDELDTPFLLTACFYAGTTPLGCDPSTVPPSATRVAIAALGGVGVRWTLVAE